MTEEGSTYDSNNMITLKEQTQQTRHRQNSRIRIVRLNRNRSSIQRSFGFSLRGGKEYGTGFFVSHVEKGSEADLRGLRVRYVYSNVFFPVHKNTVKQRKN